MTIVINDETAGDINGFDYWTTTDNLSIHDIQRKSIGVHIQLVLATITFIVTSRNLYHVIHLLIQFPYKFLGWCCFFAMALGTLITGIMGISHHFPHGVPCKAVIWGGFLLAVTTMSALNLVLVERAYLACHRNRKVLILRLVLNVLPLIAQLIAAIIAHSCHFSSESGCYTFNQPYMFYLRFIFNTLPNMIPSLIFIRVIYYQFKRHGIKSWKWLAREGIIVMLLVAFSNIVAIVVFVSGVLKNLFIIAYKLYW